MWRPLASQHRNDRGRTTITDRYLIPPHATAERPALWDDCRVLFGMRMQIRSARSAIAESYQILSESKSLLARLDDMVILLSAAPRASEAEVNGPLAPTSRTRTFDAVTELIERVERSVASEADLAGKLVEDLMVGAQTMRDPFMLIGFLLDAIVQTMQARLSPAESRQAAVALQGSLLDRIKTQ